MSRRRASPLHRTLRAVRAAVALACACAGCASVPPRAAVETPFSVPGAWTGAASDESTPAAWWTTFDDPRLDALVDEALARNFDLQAAAARVEQAAAIARIEGADLYPRLGATLERTRQKQIFIGFPIPGDETAEQKSTFWGVSLDVSWELDVWGRLRARRSASLADVQAAAADEGGARLSLAGQAAKAWFAIIEARAQLALAEQTAESNDRTARQVRARYERGVRPSLDVRLALSELENARAVAATRRRELDSATRQLETLLARYPAGALVADGRLPEPGADVPAGLPNELLSRRPDVAAAERRLAAAGARVTAARAALFPRLSVIGSRGRIGEDFDDLLDPDFGVWSLAANVIQPIFEGGRLRADVDLERARRRELLAGYLDAALRAYEEVERLLASERHLEAGERALLARAEQSEAARELAERRYLGGLEAYVTVLEAQRTALIARSEAIAVRGERLETRIDLYLALGGGFDAQAIEDVTGVRTGESPPPHRVAASNEENPS